MAQTTDTTSRAEVPPEEETERARDTGSYLFWLLLLQGLSFVLLGILVILYPAVLFVIVATTFLWIGFTTVLLAWRIRKHLNEMPATEMRHRSA